jgi:hypothetical protein
LFVPTGNDDADLKMTTGYGFASFCYILGFVVCSAASIYLSPYFCGTKSESSILSTPQNVHGEQYVNEPTAPLAQAYAVGSGGRENAPRAKADLEQDLYAGYPGAGGLNKI